LTSSDPSSSSTTTSDSSSSDDTASSSTGVPEDDDADAPLPDYDGEPLPDSPVGEWTWVEVPDAYCRDGTTTGIGVRRGATDKLVLFFEGGGACFNGLTCSANPEHFAFAEFYQWSWTYGWGGIFDDDHPDNPVRDWTVVYIPYCTGDVHAGERTDVDILEGPEDQRFTGYANVDAYLRRIVPSFGGSTDVLVTGVSAGGFGAGFNYHRLARVFPGKVTLLDDSGPVMRDEYLAPCLQQQWRDLWNLDATLPPGCDDCFGQDGGGLHHIIEYLAARHPAQRMGYVSSVRDSTISIFYSFGLEQCVGFGPVFTGSMFEQGLYDLRDEVLLPLANTGSYFIPGGNHTWLGDWVFYETVVDGVPLTDWVADLLAGEVSHVSPQADG
jgi:hypothetical protein